MTTQLEFASFAETAVAGSRATKLRNAPAWWRRLADSSVVGRRQPPAPSPRSAPPRGRVGGWLAGVIAPGVSTPAYSQADGETLPEQFTDDALRGVLEQLREGARVPLRWKHDGTELARGPLDVLIRFHRLVGLEFEARLPDTRLCELILDEAAGDRGLGVSIAYRNAKQWHVERPGVGRLRVVDGFTIDHIAVLPLGRGISPAYSAARAFGAKGDRIAPPVKLRDRAHVIAYREICKQAGR